MPNLRCFLIFKVLHKMRNGNSNVKLHEIKIVKLIKVVLSIFANCRTTNISKINSVTVIP